MNKLIEAIETLEGYKEKFLSLYPSGPYKEAVAWERLEEYRKLQDEFDPPRVYTPL